MNPDERIAQFQRVVEQSPNDEMAQFSLGSALLEAGRYKEAGPCLQRVLALNPQYSKAYLLLARAQHGAGDTRFAIDTLTNGYRVANKRGDLMPRNEMGQMLTELGAPVPADEKPAVAVAKTPGVGGFACSRCGGGAPMKERPFKGALGEKVLASVCQSCWKEWIGMGTKVINELRLPMFDPQAQELFDKHMKDFLNLND